MTQSSDREDDYVVRIPNFSKALKGILPDDAAEHLRNASREQLLALRSLIDSGIDMIEKAEEKDKADKAKPIRTEIKID
jgi:hypothetical protein